MFQHGRLNSRMKDYFDILLLGEHFAFDGSKLAEAIGATFERRETPLQTAPVGLTTEFAAQPDKQAQWAAFLRKIRATDAPAQLDDAVTAIGTASVAHHIAMRIPHAAVAQPAAPSPSGASLNSMINATTGPSNRPTF